MEKMPVCNCKTTVIFKYSFKNYCEISSKDIQQQQLLWINELTFTNYENYMYAIDSVNRNRCMFSITGTQPGQTTRRQRRLNPCYFQLKKQNDNGQYHFRTVNQGEQLLFIVGRLNMVILLTENASAVYGSILHKIYFNTLILISNVYINLTQILEILSL